MTERHPPLPLILTIAGLLPFAAGALGRVILDAESLSYGIVSLGLLTYSAVILSFLGGIRWGAALRPDGVDGPSLALSVVPSLAGWGVAGGAIILGLVAPALGILAVLFVAQLVWDWTGWTSGKLPQWFSRERAIATSGAVISLGIAALFGS